MLIREANSTIGGAARTEELTLPGFLHDVGSAVYPLGIGSPYFSSLPLREHGLHWVHPPVPLAHALDGGRAVLCNEISTLPLSTWVKTAARTAGYSSRSCVCGRPSRTTF